MALNAQRKQKKKEVGEGILRQLVRIRHDAVTMPAFADELQSHFDCLPTRYALYVHVDRAEDVLIHKRLLEDAKVSENRAAFHVRAVHTVSSNPSSITNPQDEPVGDSPICKLDRPQLPALSPLSHQEELVQESKDNHDVSQHSRSSTRMANVPIHEVTISCVDRPKLLSQLSALLADVGLNIREAHVFSTTDGFSLDVFIVDGWSTRDIEDLKRALLPALTSSAETVTSARAKPTLEHLSLRELPSTGRTPEGVVSSSGVDDWEIDSSQLKFVRKVTSGSSGDLYQGSYCGQAVAIKVLKSERMNDNLRVEFQHEVFIMRKIRHKNIVQFIGACTKPPNLCIVTEYMSGGSVSDYLHQQKSVLKMPMLLRVAIDVSKGMDYLHQNKIIHRDLKAANLLMDENEVVKVADFGVARVQAQSGIMTAETGTYRRMAPEIIEHKPYDCKADVFSFGVVLWELITGQVPYTYLTPLQAAVGVVQKGLRPTIPENIHPKFNELLQRCWKADPTERPGFSEITVLLEEILEQVNQEAEAVSKRRKDNKLAGPLTASKHLPLH
ncbi:serine/threonine-protein kinase STY46 [Physcomitrium patens]|uniref:serine/threonine-protein kinase STY46 n=1 Tax=Physcomitrium patens TaxID=3218 RepID=UPI000D176050|nr:serine/threonine-protein kinase STY46-like isoform X1 [Physcomitrium patens]XP_024393862.1 serine/threonine-protein kinase STY46-like isoform X1 [Physcomitrium patens]XP_024393863.1 serine/threonine-protein kinase STY46-like isoform X1 [Physcomitrium patens]|eukprot:XP_024393860.1 serine/threonine-protein kinase STY46-like isoform X1 [Physcomitrella patens]